MTILLKSKKILMLFPLLIPVLHSNFATAAGGGPIDDTIELKLTGKITPSSCNLTLGTSNAIAGELNYTNVSAMASATTQPINDLGTLTLPSAITLNCEGTTLIGVSTTDNRSATINPAIVNAPTFNNTGAAAGNTTRLLGLGTDSKNAKIGAYSGTFINLKVDGVAAKFSTCMDESIFTGATIEQGGALVVGACPAGQSHQVLDESNASLAGNTYAWDYKVDALFGDMKTLDSTGWKLDGSVTVQINYL